MNAGRRSQQRGAALVVALLIAAIVAIVATRVSNNYLLSFKRSVNTILGDQAQQYLISAETIASQLLLADKPQTAQTTTGGQNSNNQNTTTQNYVDHYGEEWAQAYPPVPIGAGRVLPDPILDLQARFNINALLADVAPQTTPGGPNQTPSQSSLSEIERTFIRLLQSFPEAEISQAQAQEITESLVDWLDADDNPRGFGGAESNYYLEREPAYRAANTAMHDISELRLVKGMTPALYRALRPHVVALPQEPGAQPNPRINVNTASDNVLRALGYRAGQEMQPLEPAAVASFRENFPAETGYQSVQAFTSDASWNGAQFANGLLSVESTHFLFTSRVELGELSLPMRSVLQRDLGQGQNDDGNIYVISRTIGAL